MHGDVESAEKWGPAGAGGGGVDVEGDQDGGHDAVRKLVLRVWCSRAGEWVQWVVSDGGDRGEYCNVSRES